MAGQTAVAVLLVSGLSAACLGSDTTQCGELVCPGSMQCFARRCVQPEQVQACVDKDEGEQCTLLEVEGECVDRLCVPIGCGDGVISGSEDCEAADLGGKSCLDVGFYGGVLGCLPNCRFDTAECVGRCGDDVIGPSEVCDDGNTDPGDGCSADCLSDETCGNGVTDMVAGETCDCGDGAVSAPPHCTGPNSDSVGASCRLDCTLPRCGDGIVEPPEQCDGAQDGGSDCTDFGFYNAPGLACGPLCGFDTTDCTGYCGDGAINGPEVCDGSELGGSDCADLGFYYDAPGLACSPICAFDTSGCTGYCGDEFVDPLEDCDGADLDGRDCTDFGSPTPDGLACSQNCGFDVSGCAPP